MDTKENGEKAKNLLKIDIASHQAVVVTEENHQHQHEWQEHTAHHIG